jgi:RNA polymerase sigma-70 factor (ECF subfamily)
MTEPYTTDGDSGTRWAVDMLRSLNRAASAVPPLPADETFEGFYRGEFKALVRFLVWLGAPAWLAADIAQDTMFKAFRRWDQIDHPRTWARRVASRALARHRFEEQPVGQLPEPTSVIADQDAAARWEFRQTVLQLLAQLPDRQRQVCAWRMDGFTPAEIAAELSMDPAAVRNSLMKGRKALTALIAQQEEE